jgi:hypothetical protein
MNFRITTKPNRIMDALMKMITNNSMNIKGKTLRSVILAAAILAAIVLYGCSEPTSPYEYRKEAVVNATLVAGQPIDTVMLAWTGQVDQYYSKSDLAIPGALVIVSEVGGPFLDTLVYDPINPGRYHTADPSKIILPKHTYDLYIKTPDPDVRVITGRTSVPDTFSISYATMHNGDTVRYDLAAPVNTFQWTASRNFSVYLPTVSTLEQYPALIPKAYYDDTASVDFKRPSFIVYRIGLPKDQTHSDLPWVFLNYFGKTRFDVFAVDENCSDFLNQWMALQSGELKEIRYKLKGGIGLFASKVQAKNGIEVYLVK